MSPLSSASTVFSPCAPLYPHHRRPPPLPTPRHPPDILPSALLCPAGEPLIWAFCFHSASCGTVRTTRRLSSAAPLRPPLPRSSLCSTHPPGLCCAILLRLRSAPHRRHSSITHNRSPHPIAQNVPQRLGKRQRHRQSSSRGCLHAVPRQWQRSRGIWKAATQGWKRVAPLLRPAPADHRH